MHIQEVYPYDIILVKFPDNEKLVFCRVTSINTDNVITGAYYEGDKKIELRIDDGWIKDVQPYEHRDLNGRRVIVYCND